MIESFADFERRVRGMIFSNAPADMKFCFSLEATEDASANAAGPLFEQNDDFLMFEIDVDRVRRAGPGVHSPRRAWGTLTIGLITKTTEDSIGYLEKLEQVAAWFADQTIEGIRFRQFVPRGSSALMGFNSYDCTISCDFELQAMTR